MKQKKQANRTRLLAQTVSSGRGDSNSRPHRPERCTLTGLRYAPRHFEDKVKSFSEFGYNSYRAMRDCTPRPKIL